MICFSLVSTSNTLSRQRDEHLHSRLEDLRTLRKAFERGDEEAEDLGSIFDYGLCADYVAPETFRDQREGYFRYQLSWGGPSEEFRFYVSPSRSGFVPHRIEFRFHDWGTGAGADLEGSDFALLAWYFGLLWPEPEAAIEAAG